MRLLYSAVLHVRLDVFGLTIIRLWIVAQTNILKKRYLVSFVETLRCIIIHRVTVPFPVNLCQRMLRVEMREDCRVSEGFVETVVRLLVYDEYTRHEEMAIFCVTTRPAVVRFHNKIVLS